MPLFAPAARPPQSKKREGGIAARRSRYGMRSFGTLRRSSNIRAACDERSASSRTTVPTSNVRTAAVAEAPAVIVAHQTGTAADDSSRRPPCTVQDFAEANARQRSQIGQLERQLADQSQQLKNERQQYERQLAYERKQVERQLAY